MAKNFNGECCKFIMEALSSEYLMYLIDLLSKTWSEVDINNVDL